MTFIISAPPHIKSKITVQSIMWNKVIALIPITLVAIYFFGLQALGIIFLSILAAILTELLIQRIFKQKSTIKDGNAVFIGLMLGLLMTPEVPLWLPVICSFFAISIGKHAFGGIGSYFFNPVLAAWIFCRTAWTGYLTPASTPYFNQLSDFLLEPGAGFLVEVSPILIIAGGLYLLFKKYMEWRIPLTFGLTVILFPQILQVIFSMLDLASQRVFNPLMYLAQFFKFFDISPELQHSMVGMVFFGIFFLATDTCSSPVTKKGRVIYGILCGLLVSIYGLFANYVEATIFGLFLANCVSSFIEVNTLPAAYGTKNWFTKRYERLVTRSEIERSEVNE